MEQGLEAALELALAQWQYHEELWVRGNDAAKEQVLAAIGLVRHTLMLFGGIVPRKASTHLRDLLTLMRSDHRFCGFCRDGGLLYQNGNGEAGVDRMAGKQSLAAVFRCQSAE